MTTFEVPDLRNHSNPNMVIDPSGVKDSTAGLQNFIMSKPPGSVIVLPFSLNRSGTIILNGNRTLKPANPGVQLTVGNVNPWRVVPDLRKTLVDGSKNPYYNPTGICAPWLYDLTGSMKNPYGRVDSKEDFGGYDGTTGASGVDYDAHHLSTRLTTPFLPEHQGKGLRVITRSNAADGAFSVNISQVVDSSTVRWNDHDAANANHESSTHNVAWACPATLGWVVIFTPNPAWSPVFYGGDWHGYEDALVRAVVLNRGGSFKVRDTSKIIGMEMVGANANWQKCIINDEQFFPMVNEFQHGITLEDPTAIAEGCYTHHVWGDGFAGPGIVRNFRVDATGRGGMTGHWDGKIIDTGIIGRTHHAAIDFENQETISDVLVRNVKLEGPHGIAVSSTLVNCIFDGITSRKADVTAGTISALGPLQAGTAWCGPGSKNVTIQNCVSDFQQDNGVVIHNVDGLHVLNNRWNVKATGGTGEGYVVKPYYRTDQADRCTNIDVHDNDGGPNCLGQVSPTR